MGVPQAVATAFETADRTLIRARREVARTRDVREFRHRLQNGAHMPRIVLPVGGEMELTLGA